MEEKVKPTFLAGFVQAASRDMRSPRAWGNAAYDVVVIAALVVLSESWALTTVVLLTGLVARLIAATAAYALLGEEQDASQ